MSEMAETPERAATPDRPPLPNSFESFAWRNWFLYEIARTGIESKGKSVDLEESLGQRLTARLFDQKPKDKFQPLNHSCETTTWGQYFSVTTKMSGTLSEMIHELIYSKRFDVERYFSDNLHKIEIVAQITRHLLAMQKSGYQLIGLTRASHLAEKSWPRLNEETSNDGPSMSLIQSAWKQFGPAYHLIYALAQQGPNPAKRLGWTRMWLLRSGAAPRIEKILAGALDVRDALEKICVPRGKQDLETVLRNKKIGVLQTFPLHGLTPNFLRAVDVARGVMPLPEMAASHKIILDRYTTISKKEAKNIDRVV